MKEQPLVSVIIPVYNVERYLAQCLDSVSRQIYQNLEIICVNDGSRDGSPDILRRYADEDARIQVIDKANGGVSQARNDALDCARGEYIMFVDSDDWVEPDACENAVNAMREYDADIVMWSYVSETENRSSRKVIFPETTVFEKEEVRAKLHRRFVGAMGEELSHPELVDSLCPVWGKLYRRSLIQKSGARFVDLAEIGSYEDGFFNLEVFGKADRVVYLAAYARQYAYRPEIRQKMRQSLGIGEDQLVIGHVGRFYPQKNHKFIIDIFQAVRTKNPEAVLLLVGNDAGEGGKEIHRKAEQLGLTPWVKFLGTRSDVAELLQAMDVFLFPSLFEGLSVASIEAQAAGLPVLISDSVPIECRKTDLVHVLPLSAPPEEWADSVLELARIPRRNTYEEIRDAGFDVVENAKWLQAFYLQAAQR